MTRQDNCPECGQSEQITAELLVVLRTVEQRLAVEAEETETGVFILAAYLPEIRAAIAKATKE